MKNKLTAKYIAALECASHVLDADLIPRLNHSELYFGLLGRGYRWDGKEWTQDKGAEDGPDTLIRVMGQMNAVEDATLDICAALMARGYKIVKRSALHKNFDNSEVRQYLTVAKGGNNRE